MITQVVQKKRMDKDGNGVVSPQELEAYAKKLVDAFSGLLLNLGIVGALCLSITVPLAMTRPAELDDMAKELQLVVHWAGEHCVDSWCQLPLQHLVEFVCNVSILVFVLLSLIKSLQLVQMATRMYTRLCFWMPTAETQLWFMEAHDIRPLVYMVMDSLRFLGTGVLLACGVNSSLVGAGIGCYLLRQARLEYQVNETIANLGCYYKVHEVAHALKVTGKVESLYKVKL